MRLSETVRVTIPRHHPEFTRIRDHIRYHVAL